MRRAQIGGIAAAHRGQAPVGDGDRLVEQGWLHGRQLGLDQGDLARAERIERQNGRPARDGDTRIKLRALDGEWDDLDRRRHLIRFHRRVVRQGRQRDGFVDFVDGVDLTGIDPQDAALPRIDVDAPGERRFDAQSLPEQQRAQFRRGRVFADVIGFEPRDGDHAAARVPQRFDVGGSEDAAFLESEVVAAQGVGQNRARAFLDRELCKDHRVGWPWRAAVNCASTETAISAGDLAPMARPAGPWMRASAASSNPASDRRCSRAAWVFLLPREPI